MAIYRVTYESRPWTTNAERKLNRYRRAELVREWREAFAWLAKAQRIPLLPSANIHAQPEQKGGVLQDTGACHPAVKAAIDGLVDAGVLIDDAPQYLLSIA
jgi:crossover junction endodeoxyribonuclease RusA